MKNKKLLIMFYIITYLTNHMAQFVYPARKSLSRYSFTIFQDRQVVYSTYNMETHSNYKDCITVCFNNFDRCKSIDIQIVTNTTLICRFFNDVSPTTQFSLGYLFVSTKPPNCSLSCSLPFNSCGKCKCNPSCSARNTRQHMCNCTIAAGVAKSCQEHYNNGFTQTGVYKIIPNGFPIETMCEMDKVERKNPKINTQMCMQHSSQIIQFSYALSISYCVITCAPKEKIDIVVFNSPCFCANYIDNDCDYNDDCTNSDYCNIGASSTDCTLIKVGQKHIVYKNRASVDLSINSCVSFCTNYQNANPTYNGYFASGIALTKNDCLCLYGFTGKTTFAYYGCSNFEKPPMTIFPSEDSSEQVLEQGNLIKTLSILGKIFSISLMLKPKSNYGATYNIIHLTIDSNDKYGDRIPGIWLVQHSRLYISYALSGNIYAFNTQSLPMNEWSSLRLSQTEINGVYTYTVYLNDQVVSKETNTQPEFFKNVKVYASDPWYYPLDGHIKDLEIVNGYVDFVDEASEFKIEKYKIIALLSYLDKAYSVSFKIKPQSYSSGWKSVIHLTIKEDNKNYGDRSPFVYFESGRLWFSTAVNGDKNYAFYTQPLPLNEWSSIQIFQMRINEKYIFSVYLNETLVHKIENTNPQSFENINVYAADPWYDAQDGSIKDLKIISGNKGVWIPMMTRFSSWESPFWGKSYEAYENGFGLMNQQWIGLKNLNQITSTFFTDMRIDYSFKEDITFSTLYYNVTVGSSQDKYIFRYDKYDPRGSGEPDRLNINRIVFSDCNKWWTASGSCNANIFPTSTNYISFGSAKELLSIQFFLRTNTEKGVSTNTP